ncbi:MAG TPA: ABC transporter ATP-binding protein [Phycisphaerae bacterium]|nr:ABC transporter ATP-binding protein [Phycisphaerae bacterium]
MKSSRQRFAEFREKLRKGLLDPVRFADPNAKPVDVVAMGGKHASPPGGKHVFKRKKKQLLAEYREMLRGYFWPVASLFILITASTLLTMGMPVVLQLLIDYVATKRGLSKVPWLAHAPGASIWPTDPWKSLAVLAGVMALIAIFSIVFDWLKLLATQRVNYRMAGTLRQRLHDHVIRLPLSLLSDYKTGGIVSRIMADVDQVVAGVNNAMIVPYTAVLRVFGIIFILFFTNWKLALAIAVLIPPVLAIHVLLFRRLRPMWRNIQDDRAMLSARLTDMYGGIRVVRSFKRERSELKEFGAAQDTMIRKQQYTAVLGRLLGTGWGVFGPAIGVVIVWYGGAMVLRDQMTVGKLVMFQSYIFMLLGPVSQMIDSIQNVQQNLGALDRVVDVLEQPHDMPDRPHAKHLRHAAGHIELRDVHFRYTKDREVLTGVDLNVPAGSTVAIVGPSGSGKTTLVNLVARFFDVNSGAILLDGRDIRDIRVEDYRGLFAMVLQDVYLFDGTIADNIAYGKRHATREEIIDAARRANAHNFIMELEQGYETIVGERGSKLSGGQKQRISIARALLANPRILILDEATSSLDSHSEHLIQESLRELMANRTTFVIAHRLSTIMHADAIVVLVDGKIVEQGSHDELLERRGVYHDMFTQQFQRHRDPSVERMEWEIGESTPART